MSAPKKKNRVKTIDDEEARLSKLMFAEYREENAKDLEREAIGNW